MCNRQRLWPLPAKQLQNRLHGVGDRLSRRGEDGGVTQKQYHQNDERKLGGGGVDWRLATSVEGLN